MPNPFHGVRVLVPMLGFAMAVSCGEPKMPAGAPHEDQLSKSQRLDALARATIWAQTDVAAMDLREGPQGKGAFEPFANVTCTYVEKKMDGSSPKFTCALDESDKSDKKDNAPAVSADQGAAEKSAKADEVKIKYGATNPEVSGVVASSRLLWALGYGADSWYPVHVVCHGCSPDPKNAPKPATGDASFDVAALERPVSGKTIETHPDEGWAWPEIDLTDPSRGGATRAQADGLKLLAVFLQHTDTKPQQQKMVCVEGNPAECKAPFLFLHDVGLTFGKRTLLNRNSASGPNFANWANTPVWKDSTGCVGHIEKSWTGTLDEPRISEEGRAFLSALLGKLSDKQLVDLFEVARFPQFSHVSVDQWVTAFKAKRQQIAERTCGA